MQSLGLHLDHQQLEENVSLDAYYLPLYRPRQRIPVMMILEGNP
jgi:hypothetical protein